MDELNPNTLDETESAETPEDVAVLYSWANLQGAKYRDFSASRREYRAQMRHRQAEQQREEELRAKAEAEAAAADAERAAREAEEAARYHEEEARRASQQRRASEYQVEQEARARAEAHAAELNRIAASERIEAARRAEAVAVAEAAARREAREVAEAHASAARQAARYQESEHRRSTLAGPQPAAYVPGEISDPYMNEPVTLPGRLFHQPNVPQDDMRPTRHAPSREGRLLIPQPDPLDRGQRHEVKEYWVTGSLQEEAAIAAGGARAIEQASHNPQAHVDTYAAHRQQEASNGHRAIPTSYRTPSPAPLPEERVERPREETYYERPRQAPVREREHDAPRAGVFPSRPKDTSIFGLSTAKPIQDGNHAPRETLKPAAPAEGAPIYDPIPGSPRPESSVVRAAHRSGSVPAERKEAPRERKPRGYRPDEASGIHAAFTPTAVPDSETALPAWISSDVIPVARPAQRPYDPQRTPDQRIPEQRPPEQRITDTRAEAPRYREASRVNDTYRAAEPQQSLQQAAPQSYRPAEPEPLPVYAYQPETPRNFEEPPTPPRRIPAQTSPASSPVADTLQHSRERVAARWYALKGVFEKPEHAHPQTEAALPAKEVRVPMLGVFSLAGGVGKTSLVATLGRALSSNGEKVLLSDTTSHGLLPFYFGASELRPGVVRRFSPPVGSVDAAIALVSYDVAAHPGDEQQQAWIAQEFTQKSRGMQRLLVDVSPMSSWVVRTIAKAGATILVPVAPDMNSVISLGAVEKFFAGALDSEGRPVQPYYVLNQFDASLPLHLDVREVMHQQLGDRLLPFVIRRSPVVSEALAEGMTVIDYAPDSPVAGDYMNLAQWLRGQAAPAVEGLKNARWSER